MKIGKYIPLGIYNDVKIGYGTVDFKNLKTIYIKLNSWLEPTSEITDFNSIIYKSRRKIKDIIYNLNSPFFKKESIVDFDVKTKSIKSNKKSFMDVELTLYVDNKFDLKSKDFKMFIKDSIELIIDESFTDKNLFNFSKNKKIT